MEKCIICNGNDLRKYKYGNHLNKINKRIIKYAIASTISKVAEIFHLSICQNLKSRLIFSPFFFLVRCGECGYGTYERDIESTSLFEYYQTQYWQAGGIPINQWHNKNLIHEDSRAYGQYNCVKDWISKIPNIKILEIGAGSAFFLRLLMEKTNNISSFNVVETGIGWQNYYNDVGIHLIANNFPFKTNELFGYIHTSHWLEHAHDLLDTIQYLKSLLQKDGLIFIEVPNCNDEYYTLDNPDTPHIHFFSKESLKLLFEQFGFITLSIDEYGLTWQEEYAKRHNPSTFNQTIVLDADKSSRFNIPRKNGNCLRGLFKCKPTATSII